MSAPTPLLPWCELGHTREPSHYCTRCSTRGIGYESHAEFCMDHLHDGVTPEQVEAVEAAYFDTVEDDE